LRSAQFCAIRVKSFSIFLGDVGRVRDQHEAPYHGRLVAAPIFFVCPAGVQHTEILCRWIEPEGEDWRDRLPIWFDRGGCDVWVLKNDSLATGAYAEKWIADTEPHPPEGLFERWMEFYTAERIAAIHSGAIAMRRSEGDNWMRIDAMLRAFALGDYHQNMDQHVATLVAGCTGERTVRDLIRELASESGIALEALAPACLHLVRGMVEARLPLTPRTVIYPTLLIRKKFSNSI